MATPKCFDRLSWSAVHRCFLHVVILCATCPWAGAGNVVEGANAERLTTDNFFCHAGYDPDQCNQHIAELQAVLTQYSAGAPGHWNWTIVRSEDWQPLIRSLHLDPRSPAFTTLAQRATFLEGALFFSQPKRTDQLVRDLHTPLKQLLSAAVGHELGHAVCHGGDEATANRVAEQLRSGKHFDCSRRPKSPNPIEELYLHSHLSGFPRPK